MTQYEWIKSLSPEDMAIFITGVQLQALIDHGVCTEEQADAVREKMCENGIKILSREVGKRGSTS